MVQDLRARPWELVIKPCLSHTGSQLLLLEEVASFLAQNGAKAGDTLLLSKQAEAGVVMHLERHHPAASPGRARRQGSSSLKRGVEGCAERMPSSRPQRYALAVVIPLRIAQLAYAPHFMPCLM